MGKRSKVLIIGPFQNGNAPTHGASVKNRHLARRLIACGYDVVSVDTQDWLSRPWVLAEIASRVLMLGNRDSIVVSASRVSAYRLLQLLRKLPLRARVHYWVIGGRLNEEIESGNFKQSLFGFPDSVIVETQGMKRRLACLGVNNVKVIPNFKPIRDVPEIRHRTNPALPLRFIYLGRIDEAKGCGLILDAMAMPGMSDIADVTFFGDVESGWRDDFLTRTANLKGVRYGGFLNLSDISNYSRLAGFDAMLFPTQWESEGHAGVLIDALAAALPVIATRHNDLPELVEDGVTGMLIQPRDASALADAMRRLAHNRAVLHAMQTACRERRLRYDIEEVLSGDVLHSLFGPR